MFPIPPMFPYGVLDDLGDRLTRLERETDLCLRLLLLVTERLRAVAGAEGLGPQLALVLAADNAEERDAIATRIGGLIAAKRHGEAARFIREMAGVTWDQAHTVIARWPSYSREQRTRWLQVVQLRKVLVQSGAGRPAEGT